MTPAQAAICASTLLQEHGLLAAGWTSGLDNARTRRGVCDYRRRRISISRHLLPQGEAEIRNTLLHEIAHALVGPGHGHDHVWRARARAIGCTGDRCGASMNVTPTWVAECDRCHRSFPRHRRPRGGVAACLCTRGVVPRPVLVWRRTA